MKKMTLPSFKYHPDPISTGSVVKSRTECVCCGQVRGYIYVGPVYAEEEYDECICPWCIADGSAHKKLDAEFTDEDGIGNYGEWGKVNKRVREEVVYRTPGFDSWQALACYPWRDEEIDSALLRMRQAAVCDPTNPQATRTTHGRRRNFSLGSSDLSR